MPEKKNTSAKAFKASTAVFVGGFFIAMMLTGMDPHGESMITLLAILLWTLSIPAMSISGLGAFITMMRILRIRF